MSDIKVGDKIRVTSPAFTLAYPGEYEVLEVPSPSQRFIIVDSSGSGRLFDRSGFRLDEIEKVEPEPEYKFAVGDKVRVVSDLYGDPIDTTGTVLAVDRKDTNLPYRVDINDDGYGDWFAFTEVSEYEGQERPDHTALVSDVDNLIAAFETIGSWDFTVDVLKRLRDALVEESYREGK